MIKLLYEEPNYSQFYIYSILLIHPSEMSANASELTPEELKQRLDRWSSRLGALPSLALPTDYPRPCTFSLIERKKMLRKGRANGIRHSSR